MSVSDGYDCAWLKNLTWTPQNAIQLPDSVTGTTAEWLQKILASLNITSGQITLANDVTVNDLERARLLGVTPSVKDNVVSVKTEFEATHLAISQNALSLTATITVEQGEIPTSFKLGGVAKVMVSSTLNGPWTEITPEATNVTIVRETSTTARVSITQTLDNNRFFKIIVK